jgi:ApeA N-terminal domain 1
LAWFLHEASKVTTLIAVMSGTPMAPDIINAKVSGGQKDVTLLVALREGGLCTHKSAHDFFMTCPDAQTPLASMMQAWFASYDALELPAQLALSAFHTRSVNHVEFLSLTQALEGLHRATFGGKYVTDNQYEPTRIALSNAIPSSLDPDHKAALKSRLKYGNEYSLQKRLGELQKKLDPLVAARVLKGGAVPASWVRTRNYFTHWDEESKADILEGLGMYAAMVRMRAMLRALFLGHASIPPTALLEAMAGTSNVAQELLQLHD